MQADAVPSDVAANPHDAVRRVDGALRHLERQRQSEQCVLRLLTSIVDALEATEHSSQEKCEVAPSPSGALVLNTCVGSSAVTLPSSLASACTQSQFVRREQTMQAALGAVMHTMVRSQHSVAAACSGLCWRVQSLDKNIQRLRNNMKDGTELLRAQLEGQKHEWTSEALVLATLANIVRFGCRDNNDATTTTTEVEEGKHTLGSLHDAHKNSSCGGSLLRSHWQKEEETLSADIHDVANAYDSAAYTTCRLLRSSLLETFSAQRWFPSWHVYQTRRMARYAWCTEMNDLTARRRAAQKVKWEKHERKAETLSGFEWSLLLTAEQK